MATLCSSATVKSLENHDIKGDFVLENRMYGVYGINPKTGFSVDVYTSAIRDELVFTRTSLGLDPRAAEASFEEFKRTSDPNNIEMTVEELQGFLDSL